MWFHWLAAKTRSGLSLSLCVARIRSILQFFRNWLDCKRLCPSRPQLLQFCRPSRLCFLLQSNAESYLVQDQTIGRCWHNLTKLYLDCKYPSILTQSTWIVFNLWHCVRMDGLSAHFWDSPWGPSTLCFFFCKYRQSSSCWPGCCCNFIDCGGRGMRMQYLIAIEVNLSQSYLDSKLSTIEPQSCGLQKKRFSIATGF